MRTFLGVLTLPLLMLLSGSGCDFVDPETEPRLVVSCYVNAGEPLPSLFVHRTGRLDGPYQPRGEHAVTDARVELTFDHRSIPYQSDADVPGRYQPEAPNAVVPVGESFTLDVFWRQTGVQATSRIPPPVRVDSFTVDVAEHAVEAVFADSISRNVQQGFIYPVDVTLWWTDTTGTQADSTHWIHAQVNPPASFPSAVVGYFLRTSTVAPEERTERVGDRRRWTGVYGVPVESDTSRLPSHDLTVFLLRSHTDYARFATSRNTPEQREPVSNLSKGRGIVAGISLDSVTVNVDRTGLNEFVR
jgi:hypothetical protein